MFKVRLSRKKNHACQLECEAGKRRIQSIYCITLHEFCQKWLWTFFRLWNMVFNWLDILWIHVFIMYVGEAVQPKQIQISQLEESLCQVKSLGPLQLQSFAWASSHSVPVPEVSDLANSATWCLLVIWQRKIKNLKATARNIWHNIVERLDINNAISFKLVPSMYGIFAYIDHKISSNVGKYTIHGWYG